MPVISRNCNKNSWKSWSFAMPHVKWSFFDGWEFTQSQEFMILGIVPESLRLNPQRKVLKLQKYLRFLKRFLPRLRGLNERKCLPAVEQGTVIFDNNFTPHLCKHMFCSAAKNGQNSALQTLQSHFFLVKFSGFWVVIGFNLPTHLLSGLLWSFLKKNTAKMTQKSTEYGSEFFFSDKKSYQKSKNIKSSSNLDDFHRSHQSQGPKFESKARSWCFLRSFME